MTDTIVRTPAWKVAAAWIFVGIPLLMGVFQTLLNAMKLFQ
ncbi:MULTISPECIES: MFS transporter small subunit [Pseudomonadati]|jgi:hypothetical protein|nr:hypothetical protein [Mesorhizobium sp. Root552]